MMESAEKNTIWLVDADLLLAEKNALFLLEKGYEARIFTSWQDVCNQIKQAETVPELVVVNQTVADFNGRSKPLDGIALLYLCSDEAKGLAVVSKGMADFRCNPVGFEGLLWAAESLLEKRRLTLFNDRLVRRVEATEGWERIKTASPKMDKLIRDAKRAAVGPSRILIEGEAGTGKEMLARAIHLASPKADGLFIALDAASLEKERMGAEIFGTPDGFPGAMQRTKGGTLYLGSLESMSPDVQTRFISVLESIDDQPNAPRLILSSRESLERRVRMGLFHEALLYRAGEVRLQIPPLRERPEDIHLLARLFMENLPLGRDRSLESRVLQVLAAHQWPGNVRELQNFIERTLVMTDKMAIGVQDLPPFGPVSETGTDIQSIVPNTSLELKRIKQKLREQAVRSVEQTFLLKALNRNEWNVTKSARSVGMQRPNFQALMRKYKIRKR